MKMDMGMEKSAKENDPERYLQLKLERRLKELGVWYKFVEKPESTVHTADAAGITGIDLHKISKNLIAETNDGKFAALIIPGDMRLELKQAAKALEVKNVKLVPFGEAHKISGYPPGGTPSIGYEKQVDVLLDKELANLETFYCGGGSTKMLLEVRSEDVIRVNDAKICEITTKSEENKSEEK